MPSKEPVTAIPFNNSFAALGDEFFVRTGLSPVPNPALVYLNEPLARELGMDVEALNSPYGAEVFAGNTIPEGADPLAMAYAGHQFGMFSPQLGDGRALLLGNVTDKDGKEFGIQLKGSGRTVFSRNGDGRAPLGPVLREYLVSEAMYRLGVPTTRALAIATTGDRVFRERALPGGVITRVSSCFVRVGTFEFFARRGAIDAVRALADHVIAHHYPEIREAENPYLSLLEAVVKRQADLIARWMNLGFIHGVMNTDNMSIVGETIDYGPCAFMDHFNSKQVYSSIDHQGRYAYCNQPHIGLWNLTRFAECLVPLLNDDQETGIKMAVEVLERFMPQYDALWIQSLKRKCGLSDSPDPENRKLVEDLLSVMETGKADFTLSFYYLSTLDSEPNAEDEKFLGLFQSPESVKEWLARWRRALQQQPLDNVSRQDKMRQVNPVYIPRNHLIEAAIRAAEDEGDFSPFRALHEVLENPYEWQLEKDRYLQPPAPAEVVLETFCGT